MNEKLNWNIDKTKLIDYKSESWSNDYFISSPNNKYGIVVYNINESRMGAYAGLIGIYSNFKNPKIELNSSQTWIYFQDEKTFSFLEKSECIVCRKPASNSKNLKDGFPFIIINMKNRQFAFLDFNYTSIYYGIEETELFKAKLIEIHPKDIEYLNDKKRTNEIIDLENLKWLEFIDFNRALEKYYE
ncbi:hypothetical protein BW723_14535 [Polaribacter reichenbachii]|uniref:Uncharacterized protein n=1 Tax=Polaribacter reichenbachii TaxID=996801 RepID=A0A1B8U469_9FLAO|nr:hypothetical protein [Polaribacter reichenbachii]APZ47427.1 hypothetical protein BW723_14535 [Polaribacter reichenbachii]AUC18066.1 hypothetical protein BTO17_04980 [Polaribacter reichenbachii]OBY66676.1 hypothetical protein LPB301_05605 [Polaribacter reichenbachii]